MMHEGKIVVDVSGEERKQLTVSQLLGLFEKAIATFDDLILEFGEERELSLREQVAKALLGKGVILSEQGRHKDAAAVHHKVIHKFEAAQDPSLREAVTRAREWLASIP